MPFRRNNRRTFRRRIAPRRRTMSRIARSVFNRNIEKKAQVYNLTTAGIASTTPHYQIVNVLGQGVASNQRIGNKVKWTSFFLKGHFTYADSTNIIRMLILWSRSPVDQGAITSIDIPVIPTRQDFKILFDKTMRLAQTPEAGIQQQLITSGTIRRKIGGTSKYPETGTVPEQGYLTFVVVSDSSTSAHPFFVGNIVMNYQDA